MRILIVTLLLVIIVALNSAFDLIEKPITRSRKISELGITNGKSAKTGQLKYQVGLYIEKKTGNVRCGGTLIAPTWILTAAHCIDGASKVYVSFGISKDLTDTRVQANQWVIHGGWKQKTSDICLLRIPKISLGPNIAPIALPPISGFGGNYLNKFVIASGWGITNDQDRVTPNILQYAKLKIVPNSVCLKIIGSEMFKESNICAQGQPGTSTCNGDSGGPIVTESSGVLVGITSYGVSKGCSLGYPTVFTRVSSYRQWIKHFTGI